MSEVKWIKITTSMFEDEKIKLIEKMPEGVSILLIWIKLLTLAGKCNDNGYIYLQENFPYTDEMLSTIFNMPVQTVRLAIQTFEQFGMIEITDSNFIKICNWEKHQNIKGLEKIRSDTRERVRRHRERKKLPESGCNVTGSYSNETEEEEELEEEKNRIDYKYIVNLYKELCPSLPKIKKLTPNRKKQIKARYNEHGLDGIKEIFQKAEQSDFLSGRSGKWNGCNIDWLMKQSNAIKVLEGNYDNKGGGDNRADWESPSEKRFSI